MKKDFKVDFLNNEINQLILKCTHKTLTTWALDCAERVLPYFEEQYPQDDRPRLALEAGRAWVRDELPMWEARKSAFPAHAAARDAAGQPASVAAARAAGQALGTAHVPTHAPHAATYAAKAAGHAGQDIKLEREWQYQQLIKLCENQSEFGMSEKLSEKL